MLQVGQALFAKGEEIVGCERQYAQGEGDVEIARRRQKARHQTAQIGSQNEEKKAAVEMHVAPRLVPQDTLGHTRHALDQQLGHVTQAERIIRDIGVWGGLHLSLGPVGQEDEHNGNQEGGRNVPGENIQSGNGGDPGKRVVFH